MVFPTALESDAQELQKRIEHLKVEEAAARSTADTLAQQYQDKGINVLEDADAYAEVEPAYKAADGLKDELELLKGRVTGLMGSASGEAAASGNADSYAQATSLAARFTASAQYRQVVETGVSAGLLDHPVAMMDQHETARWLRAGAPNQYHLATLVDATPLVPVDQRLVPPVEIPVRMTSTVGLFNQATTDTEVVRYATQTARTDAAAGTAMGTASPEATYTWTTADATVRWITQQIPAPKDNLADQGALQGLLSSQLGTGVRLALETQMLSGGGTGQDFEGVFTATGIGSQAISTDTLPDALHKAITLVRVALQDDISHVALHPDVYESFVLEKATGGEYVSRQGPQNGTSPTVWGYPCVVTTAVANTTALVGNFAAGATLWTRQGLTVTASSENADNFEKGLVTFLAEMRAAFAVTQPKAFAEVTGIT